MIQTGHHLQIELSISSQLSFCQLLLPAGCLQVQLAVETRFFRERRSLLGTEAFGN